MTAPAGAVFRSFVNHLTSIFAFVERDAFLDERFGGGTCSSDQCSSARRLTEAAFRLLAGILKLEKRVQASLFGRLIENQSTAMLRAMLSQGDDYPIHQTPEPIAYAGSDRNFYDRYFFNGYARDASVFFAVALGTYPGLNVMDASFAVVLDGAQHNLHASREMLGERMVTVVGPIEVEVVKPLASLRVRVSAHEHGVAAELLFRRRAPALEEPRFTLRQGPRTVMDYTRLTQSGDWEGWIEVGGKRLSVTRDRYWGTRDRSWGVRPVGAADPQPVAPPALPQFFWLWAPCNFDDCISLYHDNADASGKSWNTQGVICGLGDAEERRMSRVRNELTFKSGTRHVARASLFFEPVEGGEIRIDLETLFNFYMSGVGYVGSEWAHGTYKGALAVGYDQYDLANLDENELRFLHIQAITTAVMTGRDGKERRGCGVLEQLFIGAHAPSGLTGLLDPAM